MAQTCTYDGTDERLSAGEIVRGAVCLVRVALCFGVIILGTAMRNARVRGGDCELCGGDPREVSCPECGGWGRP